MKILYVIFISGISCGCLLLIAFFAFRHESILPNVVLTFVVIGLGIYLLIKRKTLIGIGLLVGGILHATFWIIFFIMLYEYGGM